MQVLLEDTPTLISRACQGAVGNDLAEDSLRFARRSALPCSRDSTPAAPMQIELLTGLQDSLADEGCVVDPPVRILKRDKRFHAQPRYPPNSRSAQPGQKNASAGGSSSSGLSLR